jgi:Protein of Unknown function (DUF2784)
MYPSLFLVVPMIAVLLDITIAVHFFWILFLVFGFIFALKGSRIAYVHLGGLVFALVLNAMGWYCPLTYLENYFRALQEGHSIYSTSFLMKYVETLLYPNISENILRGGEIVVTGLYILVYAYWAKRTGVWRCSGKI